MSSADAATDRPTGWYADPVTVGAARYWDGASWSEWVSWGGRVVHDPTPLGEVDRRDQLARASIVADYLADVERREVVAPTIVAALRRDIDRSRHVDRPSTSLPSPPLAIPTTAATTPSEAMPASSRSTDEVTSTTSTEPTQPMRGGAMPVPAPRPSVPDDAPSRPTEHIASVQTAADDSVPLPLPLPAQPGRTRRWWNEVRETLRGDLALHGLAYLGVLLLFAGVTGLITFSFGDVDPWVRSVAEFLVPGALLLSSWYLRRRGAEFVATALLLLGGSILPIIVAASLTDGGPVPPDLHGRSLPLAQGAAVALVAVAMVVAVRRSPASPMRFVAGPALWMAAGLAAGVVRDPAPAGYDTARPDSIQLAVILATITATVLACSRTRLPAALSEATRLVAVPSALVVFLLEMVLAADEGWPVAGTVIVGAGTLLLLELSPARIGASATSMLQLAAVMLTAARLSEAIDPAWVAVALATALLLFVEYTGRRRPSRTVVLAGLASSGGAFALSLADPWTRAVGAGVLLVWGLWRHRRPADWLPVPDRAGVVPAIAAGIAATAWWEWSGPGPALVGFGAVVLAIALAGRRWRVVSDDLLWQWFVPVAAGLSWLASLGVPLADEPVGVAAASAMFAAAIGLSRLSPAVRVWAMTGPVVWSLANLAQALDLSRDVQAVALAVLALVVLTGAVVRGRPIDTHLAAIAHLGAFGALAVPIWPGWGATLAVGAATIGWFVVTIVDQRLGAVHLEALRSAAAVRSDPSQVDMSSAIGYVPPIMSFLGLPATLLLAADAGGWVARDDPWAAAIAGGIAVLAGLATRLTPWKHPRRDVLAWLTLAGAVVAALVAIAAAGADRDHWAPIVCLGLVLAVVGVAAAPRPRGFDWVAWTVGAMLTVYLFDRFGVGREWADITVAGWGSVALVGGLAVHRTRHGPLPVGSFVHDAALRPPVVLGSAAFAIGGTIGLSDGTETAIGWTAAGMAGVVLVVAILLPLGVLVGLAELLGTAAYTLLAPWEPIDRPWTLAPWVVGLLGAATATRRSGGWSPARWDLPSFVVAHLVAALALVAAVDRGSLAPTAAAFGAISIAIAVALRRSPWAVGGAVLLLLAGADAGPGWLALVLVVEGIASTVAGLRRAGIVRSTLLAFGAIAVVAAWFDVSRWQSWTASTVFLMTVPGAAVVTLVAVAGWRTTRLPADVGTVWATVGSLVVLGTAAVTIDDVSRRPGGLTLTASLLILAVAAALSTTMVGAIMRWVAVAPVVAAWWSLLWAAELSSMAATTASTALALTSSSAAMLVGRRWPGAPWILPGMLFVASTQFGAGMVAVDVLPARAPLIAATLAIAAELTVLGVLIGRPEPHALAPVAAAAGWLVAAQGAAIGEIHPWAFFAAVPIAATVALVAAAVVRFVDVRRALAGAWAVAASFVVLGTVTIGLDDVDRRPGGLVVAGSFVVAAAATGLVAPILGSPARWATAALLAFAWTTATWAVEPSAGMATTVTTAAALGLLSAALFVGARRPDSPWLRPSVILAGGLQLGAMFPALDALPDRDLLIVALLAISAESMAVGTLLQRPAWYVATPVPACVAWLLYASHALSGAAIWFTVPVGFTLLVMVGQVRWIRRGRGGDPSAVEVVALECAGMSFLVASSLARTLSGHLWQGVIAIGIGVAIAAWGVTTRVRWRGGFGAASVLLAVCLLLGVPLSRSITWRGPTLWVSLALAGIAAILVASILERNRRKVTGMVERLDHLTSEWERVTPRRRHGAASGRSDRSDSSGSVDDHAGRSASATS